jgi:fatty acid desaturase
MSESSDTKVHERHGEYELARRQVAKKRKVVSDAVAYVVINAFLVGIWAFNGAGAFWPGWVLAGWGVLLVLDIWSAFFRRPVTDADVLAELERRRGGSGRAG